MHPDAKTDTCPSNSMLSPALLITLFHLALTSLSCFVLTYYRNLVPFFKVMRSISICLCLVVSFNSGVSPTNTHPQTQHHAYYSHTSVLLLIDGCIILALQTETTKHNQQDNSTNLSEVSTKLQLPTEFELCGISARWRQMCHNKSFSLITRSKELSMSYICTYVECKMPLSWYSFEKTSFKTFQRYSNFSNIRCFLIEIGQSISGFHFLKFASLGNRQSDCLNRLFYCALAPLSQDVCNFRDYLHYKRQEVLKNLQE
jgi:hypothetical protein